QPTLSTSLSSLEEELGVKLFSRTSTGVKATEEGGEIVEMASKAIAYIDQIRYYRAKDQDLTGEVRLLMTPAYSGIGYQLITTMNALYPSLKIIIEEDQVSNIVEKIEKGNANVGLLTWGLFPEQTVEMLTEKNLGFQKLNRRELKAFVSVDDPLAKADVISVNDIRNERLLAYSSSYWASLNQRLHTSCEPFIIRDKEDLKKGVYRGHAIALLPDLYAVEDIYCQHGLIKLVPLKEDIALSGYDCILYPRKRALSIGEKKVIDIIRNILTGPGEQRTAHKGSKGITS
ncbi:MAG: LysR family transcriptional regulator, partial [Dehalobacterium sp.]